VKRVTALIIGEGPAGSAAALTLARAGASVLVIDRSADGGKKIGESLPPSAGLLLRDMGLWDRFLSCGHRPSYGNRSAWGSPDLDNYDFIFEPGGVGWHLDRSRFDALLVKATIEAGALRQCHTRLVSCNRAKNGLWRLGLVSPEFSTELYADFVVDASGPASVFARRQGASRKVYDRMVGAVAWFACSTSGGDPIFPFTVTEAVQDGWWYVAPVPNGQLAVGYMSDADLVRGRNLQSVGGWTLLFNQTRAVRELVEAHGYRLLEGAPRLVRAASSVLSVMAGDSWVAVGDAVATHDPLSSQGITSALASGVRAGESIHSSGQRALQEYESWIKEMYAGYMAYRAVYYAMEQRWPNSPFWRRRHGVLSEKP
jgi:flavin-dependent dehydrogenase